MPRKSQINIIDPCPFDVDILCNNAKVAKDMKDRGIVMSKCRDCSYSQGQVRF